ncbi:MerR family DNA-binding transcriptional regulator [Herbidospora galbida]|uniref:MerR family DNA-binding transcriptional regulator n=1 Tax=Herbidospora galbida TaxID=2575442 RepID=A0A4U3MBG8_9ACTN|nr:TioE family transcriptional regulator [Herbidospora galbida]TKK86548.1 MerR family DNA-binding transcriptional regulator [Herbidospora galbida]
MRPADLAREHGISTQAVRNYEQAGCLPPAGRTPSGYRVYTEAHAAALHAFLGLVPAYGHATAVQIMNAVHDDRLDDALALVDAGHVQLLRDRETLDAVRGAVHHLTTGPGNPGVKSIGALARRLGLTPATLRTWEEAGILDPARDPATGYRLFRADDVRDAELAHLLRRGGYPLAHVATVIRQIRTAGGAGSLARALDDWRRRLTARGLATLHAAARLSSYLAVRGSLVGAEHPLLDQPEDHVAQLAERREQQDGQ